MEIIDYFYKGGDIMWVILFALVMEIGIILERSFFYFFNSYPVEKYEKYLKGKLMESRLKDVPAGWIPQKGKNFWQSWMNSVDVFRLENSVIYGITSTYLNNVESPEEAKMAALNGESGRLLHIQERGLSMLSLIGQVAPLLGLLGTVTGMIKAFFVISSLGGQVDVTKLAGGISEAMLTTAFGLIVAIPAYIFHDYFNNIINNRVERINRIINLLEEYFHKEKVALEKTSALENARG